MNFGFNIKVFAFRLKSARTSKALTQKQLANIINVDPSKISKYENAKITPNIENLYKLCSVLDESADYLLGDPLKFSKSKRSQPLPYA